MFSMTMDGKVFLLMGHGIPAGQAVFSQNGMALVALVYKDRFNITRMMKTLLTLVRNPADSEELIRYASGLAADMHTNLSILFIENPANYPMGAPDSTGVAVARLQKTLEEKNEEARRVLMEQLDSVFEGHSKDIEAEVFTSVGNETRVINEFIQSGKAHMVLLESTGFDSFLVKDTFVRQVVRHCECPVWVVPEESNYKTCKQIIYATDYHEEDLTTIQRLIELTAGFKPNIHALHVTADPDFENRIKNVGFQKMVESKTGYDKITVKALTEKDGSEIVDLINGFATSISADLIVVLKENKNFLDRIFQPSSTEKLIKEVDRPVLVFHM